MDTRRPDGGTGVSEAQELAAGGSGGRGGWDVFISLGQTVVVALLNWMDLYRVANGERIIYYFVLFVSLSVFAGAYSVERFKGRKADVPGFPVG